MSWATCYKTPHNIHLTFPGVMNDGRLFTSYNPNTVMNNELKKINNINSNQNYKQFLQNNAMDIMKMNGENCQYLNNTTIRFNENIKNGNPYLYHESFEKTQPYGYENSGVKNMYLSRQELNAKKTLQYL
jgi:hypothetical protein